MNSAMLLKAQRIHSDSDAAERLRVGGRVFRAQIGNRAEVRAVCLHGDESIHQGEES